MNYVMLLCAGFGKRLKCETLKCPKPMLRVNKKPILEYTINHLAKLNLRNIIINLHYMPEKISSYFGDGSSFGVNIIYSYEETPLGTAGGLKNAESYFKNAKNILVIYGDVICFEDYRKFILFRESKNATAVILIHEREHSNSIVEIDTTNKITRFIERPTKEITDKKQNWVNSGVYCFNQQIFSKIPKSTFSDFPKDIFPKLIKEDSIYGYPLNAYRCSIDTEERYGKVQIDLRNYFKKGNFYECC